LSPRYVEHSVAPPACRAELREQFLARRSAARDEAASAAGGARESKLALVRAMWSERTRWWAEDFSDKIHDEARRPPRASFVWLVELSPRASQFSPHALSVG